jgi:putative hydrolases of HD superfamily
VWRVLSRHREYRRGRLVEGYLLFRGGHFTDRLEKQLGFLVEIDKAKAILRKTKLFDGSRVENDAEHSWHIAIMAMVLAEHANEDIDLARVMKMLLIHDLVEIDAGDYIIYTKATEEKEAKELLAAERIFGMLPDDQKAEFRGLWAEFEARKTIEARFAAALDRLEPVMQNHHNHGDTWRKFGIPMSQIMEINQRIGKGSETLWEYAKSLIEEFGAAGAPSERSQK